VAILATYLNWRMAFVAAGSLGFIWLIFWIWLYRKPEEHKSVSAEELALIRSDPIDPGTGATMSPTMPWLSLFPRRETWAFAVGKFMTDPIWWFWTFWLPRYFQKTFHLTLGKSSAPLMVIYAVTCFGSVGGGWLSSTLLHRGWTLNAARKTALLVCALCVLPVLSAPYMENMWVVVGLVALACAAHQGFSANMLTMPSDLFPKSAIGSVVGIGSMFGALVGCVLFISAGYISRISYTPLFVYAGSGYLVALLLIHILSPKLEPAKVN
jgi:ACS family hexuronate transporter-like MFS transporter